MTKLLVDLGCGLNKQIREGYKTIGIDIFEAPDVDVVCNLGHQSIPLEKDTVDFVTAIQLIEHIPRISFKLSNDRLLKYNPFIELMNEIYRICKDGATVEIHVPKPNSKEFWQDPTHVNGIVDETWIYFRSKDKFGLKEAYGIKTSFILESVEDRFWYKKYFLKAVKSESSKESKKDYFEIKKSFGRRFYLKMRRFLMFIRAI